MKILIIEDEPTAARHLQSIILEIRPGAEIAGMADSVVTGIELLKTVEKPDLIFTDIQLADGLSFEIFSEVEPPAPLVFTTAFDEYAIKAFRFNSLDYLLKPYKKSEVEKAILKFEKNKPAGPAELQMQLQQILSGMGRQTVYKTRFLFQTGPKLVPVSGADIAWFEAKNKFVYAHTRAGAEYISDETMDQLENMLDPQLFFRISRGMILNRSAIVSISKYFSGRLKIETQPIYQGELTVSRERVADFRNWMAG